MKNQAIFNKNSESYVRTFTNNLTSSNANENVNSLIVKLKGVYVSILVAASLIFAVLGFKTSDILMSEMCKGMALLSFMLSIHAMSKIRSPQTSKNTSKSMEEVADRDFA